MTTKAEEERERERKADEARATERRTSTAHRESDKDPHDRPDLRPEVSPEGVPYQSSGGWPDRDYENPGPFDEGEGRNSPLLRENVEQGEKNDRHEAEMKAENEKARKTA